METTNKKAVIYCRVSTKEQVDEGGSLASQEKICKEYALKNGYEITEVYIEQGESAKNKDRTQLGRLIAYCTQKKNGISAVIAYKVDRIARNIDDYRYIRVLLKKYGVEIKSTSEYFEDTPAGRFMENIIANVAQFDNDVRTERSVGGMRDAMREGRYVWKAPLGYSNMKVGNKSTIVQNEQAPLILSLFEEVAKNKSPVDAIRRDLWHRGLMTKKGKLLYRSHCYKLLNNEVYAGWIIKFGERHKGLYEPLVSEAMFEQVQRVLKRRSHKGHTYQHENPDFPLRRFVYHPSGKMITGAWAQGRTKKYAYYRFMGISGAQSQKSKLEKAYTAFINRYIFNPVHIQDLKKALKEGLDDATETEFREAQRLKAYIAELNEKQTSLIEKNHNGVISDSILRRQLELVDEKLIIANAELLTKPDKKEDIDELMQLAATYLENPGIVWQNASFKQKLALQWFVFPQGIILQNKKLRTTKVASIFNAKTLFLPRLSSRVPLSRQGYEHTGTNKSPPIPIETCKDLMRDISRLAEILKEQPP